MSDDNYREKKRIQKLTKLKLEKIYDKIYDDLEDIEFDGLQAVDYIIHFKQPENPSTYTLDIVKTDEDDELKDINEYHVEYDSNIKIYRLDKETYEAYKEAEEQFKEEVKDN